MGRIFTMQLDNEVEPKYACNVCLNELCYCELDIIRSDYQCQSGTALFSARIINIVEGAIVHKHFISGHYMIQDVFCNVCLQLIGWKYIEAKESENKFKEGNYVIELIKVQKIEPSKIPVTEPKHDSIFNCNTRTAATEANESIAEVVANRDVNFNQWLIPPIIQDHWHSTETENH